MEKLRSLIKRLTDFMFSQQGICSGLQYFLGIITLNIIAIAMQLVNFYIYILYLLLAVYSQLCLVQKRSRAINKNGDFFIIATFAVMFASVLNQVGLLEWHIIWQMFVVLIMLFGLVAHFYLIFKKSQPNPDLNKTAFLMRRPKLTALVIWLLVIMEMFIIGTIMQSSGYQKEKVYNLVLAQGIIYRNTQGYVQVCQDNGYVLQNYPREFMLRVQDENDYIKQELDKLGVNNLMSQDLPQDLVNNVTEELQQIREIIAREDMALDNHENPSKVSVSTDNLDKVNLSDACEFIDRVYVSQLDHSQAVNVVKKIVADYRN